MQPVHGDVLEDEVFQIDVVARLLHRLEHRRKRLRAVPQQARLIAEYQWTVGECVLQRVMALQRVGIAGRCEIGIDVGIRGAGLQCRGRGQGEKVPSA